VEGPEDGALPVTLVEALNVGPLVRIEFIRTDDGSQVDVEMPRRDYTLLQERLGLQRGSRVWLKAARVTRFPAGAADSAVAVHPRPRPETVEPAAVT
jgi:hypothetical protein